MTILLGFCNLAKSNLATLGITATLHKIKSSVPIDSHMAYMAFFNRF